MTLIQKRRFGRILLTVTIFCILFLQETNVNSQTNWPWVNKKKTGETPFYRGGENSSASTKEEKEVPASMTLPEIQGAVMSFADTFGAMVGDFATILENQATSAQGRINAAKMRLWGISSVLQIASGPYPGVALLDMVVLTTLNRIVWEEFWRPKVYGEQADLMVDALRKLEADIWGIAAKVLTTDQQKEMRELILEWRKKNPSQCAVVHFVVHRCFDG